MEGAAEAASLAPVIPDKAWRIRRNDDHGDCPGRPQHNLRCPWGATRESKGNGKTRSLCTNCNAGKEPPAALPKRPRVMSPPSRRPPRPAPVTAFEALNGTANSPRQDMSGRPPDYTRWTGNSHARLDSTTVEDDPHWSGGARKYSRWDQSWDSLCPYISCEQIDSMLAEDGVCKTARKYGPCSGCFYCSRMFCTMCRHLDRTNAFSFAHGGCGVFKRNRVASHAKTFHPQEQGTRDLGDLFEEGLRKEHERMIALIKEAYWLAYEGMPMHKFYSLTTLLWHQNFKGLDGQRIHLGKKYVNSTAARDFSHALAAELRERMNADLRKARMFSVMLDESTDKGQEKSACLCALSREGTLRHQVLDRLGGREGRRQGGKAAPHACKSL